MKTIIIDNQSFEFDFGCKLLKLKYNDCPFPELEGIWNDIQEGTFKEISQLPNIEKRRVGIKCLGIDKLVKEVEPLLIDKKTIKKETTWVDKNGKLVHKKFNDTYELYEVSGKTLGLSDRDWTKVHYVKCKDTSTNREYLIWVERNSVERTNDGKPFNSIQAIAWTIQTNIRKGDIEEIVRQGDCILIKPKSKYEEVPTRHLTEKEYRELLICES